MTITNALRPRRVASWASLACVAVLLTACNSPAGSAASSATGTASTTGTVSTPPSSPAPTGGATFLAAGQNLNGTLLHEPACGGYGCALSGDSTAFLSNMTWTTWSGTKAVGTGAYKLDDCQPNCAAGTVHAVSVVVTFSQPVKVCSSSGTRWVWSHASFTFPDGLPEALQGQNAPQNPWTFTPLIAAAQQTCS